MRRSVRYLLFGSIICLLSWCLRPPVMLAGSAISVPPEARDTAAALIGAAQGLIDSGQGELATLNNEEYLRKAEFDVSEAKKLVGELEQLLTEREAQAERAEAEQQAAEADMKAAIARAEALHKEIEEQYAAVAAAYKAAAATDAHLQALAAAANQAQQKKEAVTMPPKRTAARRAEVPPATHNEEPDELIQLENEMRRLEKARREADEARKNNTPMVAAPQVPVDTPAQEIDWSLSTRAHARARNLEQRIAAAEKQSEEAWKLSEVKTAAWSEASTNAAYARLVAMDTKLLLDEARQNTVKALVEAEKTKKSHDEYLRQQQGNTGVYFASLGMNYYSWRGEGDRKGRQFSQPLYVGYWQNDFSYGLFARRINSRNSSAEGSGSFSGFTDTVLYLNSRNDKPKYMIDYSLGISMPTGRAALSWTQRYAVMNEDLVETSEFGRGWKFMPGISVSRRIGKEDMWTIGTSYTASTSYDPTSDIPDDKISPGGEWRQFLRWRHVGRDWQFVGEIIHTMNGITRVRNGTDYRAGNNWEYRLTYNRKLSQDQDLMLYYWRESQGASDVAAPDAAGLGPVHFIGTMWSKKINDRRILRVTFDVMKSDGTRYAGIYNDYDSSTGQPIYSYIEVSNRTKYTAGIGYDMLLDANSRLSVDVQRFIMKDGPSSIGQPATKYKGFNVLLKYTRNF